jgi:hypothetical protein
VSYDLTVFGSYRVRTSAGRTMDLLFRGHPKNSKRLWFSNLDPPYEDVFLRPGWIKALYTIGPSDRRPA